MKTLALSILFLFLSTSLFAQYCSTDSRFTSEPYFTEAQINSQLDITYATATTWQGNNQALKLDVYYPILAIDTLPLRPLILMVHGGGLVSGDKINYTRVCKEFAKRGFVAVTINYRLGLNCNNDSISEEKAKYRAQQDIRSAFRFVVENAGLLRVDTAWMFIGGGSAGSVASLGTVYISQAEWNAFTPGLETILGSLNSSGNNLTNPFSIKGIFNDWGAMLKTTMQPEEMLPTISFHGEADSTVAIDSSFGGGCVHVDKSYGSRAMHNLLIANGVCSDLSVKPGGGHGVYQDSIFGTPFRVGRAACFFKSLFCNTCTSIYQVDSVPASCNEPVGLTKFTQPTNWTPYPNPFHERINITSLSGLETFSLFNPIGQVLFSGIDLPHQDFSNLEPGLYFLQVISSQKTETFSLQKL